MFKRKPKKLSLRQVHELYLLLRPYLPETTNEFLIDEIEAVVSRIDREEVFIRSLEIMYDRKPKGNPLDMLLQFTKGIKANDFFTYVDFIRKLKHG